MFKWKNRHFSLGKLGAVLGLTSLCLAGALFVAPALGSLSTEAAEESDSPQVLSLDEAVELSLELSVTARLAELDLNDARIGYEQAKAQNLIQGSSIALAEAESDWKVARRNHALALQELRGAVEEAYYGVLRAQFALELRERALETARRRLEVTQAKLAQGMVSEVELLTAESGLATAESDLASAQADLTAAGMQFNHTVGRELAAPVRLVDEFTYEPVSLDLETLIDSALGSRVELLAARDALARRERALKAKQNDYTPELAREQAENALERAGITLQNQLEQIELEVRRKFQLVEQARRTIELRRQAEAIAREELRIAELQRDAGILTDLEVLDAASAFQKAQADSLQAVFDYNIALLDLYRAAGMERR